MSFYIKQIIIQIFIILLSVSRYAAHASNNERTIYESSPYTTHVRQMLELKSWTQSMAVFINDSKSCELETYRFLQALDKAEIKDSIIDSINHISNAPNSPSPEGYPTLLEEFTARVDNLKNNENKTESAMELIGLISELLKYTDENTDIISEDQILNMERIYGSIDFLIKKMEKVELQHINLKEKSDEINALIDSIVDGINISEMISSDTHGVDHYAYVFTHADALKKPTRIFYYVHGGPSLSICDPNSFRYTAEFLEKNRNYYEYKLGLSSDMHSDRTLSVLPFIKQLINSGYLVVCLNYPGCLIHGQNWFDEQYQADSRVAKSPANYHIDLESALAIIIKEQITDLTPKILERYALTNVPMTFLGHSVGGGIGGALIAKHSDFLAEYFSSILLACPCILHNSLLGGLTEKAQAGWSNEFIQARNARIDELKRAIVTFPVAIISGELDGICPAATESKTIYEALRKNKSVQYHEIAGAQHSLHNITDLIPDFLTLIDKETKKIIDLLNAKESEIPEDMRNTMRLLYDTESDALRIFDEYKNIVLAASERGTISSGI